MCEAFRFDRTPPPKIMDTFVALPVDVRRYCIEFLPDFSLGPLSRVSSQYRLLLIEEVVERTDALLFACRKGHKRYLFLLLSSMERRCPHRVGEALVSAAKGGSHRCCSVLLTFGAEVNYRLQPSGWTALAHACCNSVDDRCLPLLLRGRADPNVADGFGVTPLMLSAKHACHLAVERLLHAGASPLSEDDDGWTPLMYAANTGRHLSASLLLSAGAEVDRTDLDGWTSLMGSSLRGHLPCVKVLLAAKADIHRSSRQGASPLLLAAQNGRHRCVRELLLNGANPNQGDVEHATPLAFACKNGHLLTVRELLRAGSDPSLASSFGWTPLMLSCKYNRTREVDLLVDARAPLDALLFDGSSALTVACENGHFHCTLALLVKGANPNLAKFFSNTTPLMACCQKGNHLCARILVRYGANRGARKSDGMTAHDVARGMGWFLCMREVE